MYASFSARWRARGDHTYNTTAAVALFLYSRSRRTSSSIWLSLLVFSLSLFVSVSRRFSSLPALSVSSLPALCSHCSHLCWRSASCLPLFCSGLCYRLLPSLLCFRLISPRLRLSLVAWPSTQAISKFISLLLCSKMHLIDGSIAISLSSEIILITYGYSTLAYSTMLILVRKYFKLPINFCLKMFYIVRFEDNYEKICRKLEQHLLTKSWTNFWIIKIKLFKENLLKNSNKRILICSKPLNFIVNKIENYCMF